MGIYPANTNLPAFFVGYSNGLAALMGGGPLGSLTKSSFHASSLIFWKEPGRAAGACGRSVKWLRFCGANGHQGATVQLEHLWHRLCQKEAFSPFCAYPRSGFTDDAEESMRKICDTHSRVVARQ